MARDYDNSAFRTGAAGGRSEQSFGSFTNRMERDRGYDGRQSPESASYGPGATAFDERYVQRSRSGGAYSGRDQRAFGDTYAPLDDDRHTGGFGNQTGFYVERGGEDEDRRYPDSDRGWMERAGDEVASWFGDEEAAARRDLDHRGRGPKGYVRSDDKMLEDVSERMFHDPRLDASNIELSVTDGEVTMDGTVDSRQAKRRAEDLADSVAGIGHVQNNLRVDHSMNRNFAGDQRYGYTAGATPRSAVRSSPDADVSPMGDEQDYSNKAS